MEVSSECQTRMASSKAMSDENRTRFFRLISVIIEDLTTMLQDLLRREISPSQLFNKVKQNSKHLRPDQILRISNAKTQGYKEFDITLLYTLLRNFCPNIQPPTQSWGMSNMPAQGETTEGDDIERIRLMRNKLLGHISEPTVTASKFQTEWRIISDICTRMQARLPNTHYVQKIEEAKDRTIDSDMEKCYMEKIKELVEDENTVKKLLLKLLEDRALTSSENITIEAKAGQKRKFVETFSEICIRILNEMIDTIHGLTSESEIEQLYDSVEDFIRENRDIDNRHLENMLKGLEEKIKTYAKLQDGQKMKILARFLKFSLGMKKNYGACVESSKGSLILTVTFSSTKCYDFYKKDLENGAIGQQILQLISYPPYLASFNLKADDLVVCMNGQELTRKIGDESIPSQSHNPEACADHPDQYYTRACQQCQLPVCVLCMDLLEHKDHSFIDIYGFLSEKKTKLYESLKQCYLAKIRLVSRKKQLETQVDEMKSMMNAKYQALKQLLDEYLLQNTKTIVLFLESQTDEIDSKVEDIDRYMSDVNKKLEDISKTRPAQAMIQLQSCSLREDLFQAHRIVYPDIATKDTDLMNAINRFGKIPKGTGAKRLIEHTPPNHPDFPLLKEAEKVMHDFAIKLGTVNESQHEEDQQATLKRLELLLITDLAVPDRQYIRHDMVQIMSKKDQWCIWTFSDLIIISSLKRRTGTVTRKSIILKSPTGQDFAENIKHKVWLKVGLDAVEIVKSPTNLSRRNTVDPEQLEEDIGLLNDVSDLITRLNCPHSSLEEIVKDMLSTLNKQLSEAMLRNPTAESNKVDILVTTQEAIYPLEIMFTSWEKRITWEATVSDAKQKLAQMFDKRAPEFLTPLPITKTRAGMQFSCAAPIDGVNNSGYREVWVCNSDGYVGHMCLLSLQPEPIVTLNTPVPGCNARILCICAVPAYSGTFRRKSSGKKHQHQVISQHPLIPRVSEDGPRNSVAEGEDGIEEEEEEKSEKSESESESSDEDTPFPCSNENIEDPMSVDVDEEGKIPPPADLPEPTSESVTPNPDPVSSNPDPITVGSWIQDSLKSTMWLGTEDGCIHVFQCTDNIKTTKNKLKIHHESPVYCIVYLDNKVFASLANGDLIVYKRDNEGIWDAENPYTRSIGTVQYPINKMLAVAGKLWCGCQNVMKVINPLTLSTETSFQVISDSDRCIQCLVCSGQGVWMATQQSSKLLLYHATSYEFLLEVSIAQAVAQKLQSADDIIRQHKAACLRITSLMVCKDLLWVGTSAGVILTITMPRITSTTTRGAIPTPTVTGLVNGHTGHVRFLTCVEMTVTSPTVKVEGDEEDDSISENIALHDIHRRSSMAATTTLASRMLVISGGDGYEDFRNNAANESAGRDDSTNHLLIWQV